MKLFCLLFLLFLSLPVFSEDLAPSDDLLQSDDLLLSDDLQTDELIQADDLLILEPSENKNKTSWLNDLRVSLQSDFRQSFGDDGQVELERASVRLQYEAAPWESTYFKLDGKYSYFGQFDTLARTANESYGIQKLNDAWFQYSYHDCAIKLGVQAIFWGAVDGAFALDVITPFDTTEPLLTDYSSIRSSQNMVSLNCYQHASEIELFYIPNASLDINNHKNRSLVEDLEDQLKDEWGLRISKHWEGVDVSLMTAHLYGNAPSVELALPTLLMPAPLSITGLVVPRYDLFGFTGVWAIERLLVQFDAAYKTDQFTTFTVFHGQSKNLKDKFEFAMGLEYTNAYNHQFHMGFWRSEALRLLAADKKQYLQTWNIAWQKQYIHDTLALSLLGYWIDKPERYAITVLAEYQWDDYWTVSSAIQYMDSQQLSFGTLSGLEEMGLIPVISASNVSAQFSIKYQF